MLINTIDGVKIQGELIGGILGISFRDADGLKCVDLTIEEAIDFANALQKKIYTALYEKTDAPIRDKLANALFVALNVAVERQGFTNLELIDARDAITKFKKANA